MGCCPRNACRLVASRPTDAEVAPYWQQLSESNRSRLIDATNADYVLAGQTFLLPDVPAGYGLTQRDEPLPIDGAVERAEAEHHIQIDCGEHVRVLHNFAQIGAPRGSSGCRHPTSR